jgi:hypothetical protein
MKRLYEENLGPVFRQTDSAVGEADRRNQPKMRASLESYQSISAGIAENDHRFPRVLIGILSCHQRTPGPQAQRQTWIKEAVRLGIEYRFFLGGLPQTTAVDPRRPAEVRARGESRIKLLYDQVFLDVPDTYPQLPQKTRALIRWAYERGYDFVFKCDDDTYVCPDRLLKSGFEKSSYSGFVRTTSIFGKGKEVEHAQGGAGYWLSRKTMELVLWNDETMEGAEDINIARLLRALGVVPSHDPRYRPDMRSVPAPWNEQITAHDCGPEDMYEIHRKFEFDPSAACSKELGREPDRPLMERVELPLAAASGRVL